MKTKAWYKIYHDEYGDVVLLSFKIDDLVFSFNFYCKKIPSKITRKQLGTKILELLVLRSTFISIKDHLSDYVFDKLIGYQVDISENKILVSTANRMRRIVQNFKYDTNHNLKQQTHTLYYKIWNTGHFTRT